MRPHAPAQVHESETGTLLRVLEAVRRGRQLKCSHCGRRGASVGCRVMKCKATYHALCAQKAGCPMYLKHLIACPQHARRFAKDAPHPQCVQLLPLLSRSDRHHPCRLPLSACSTHPA